MATITVKPDGTCAPPKIEMKVGEELHFNVPHPPASTKVDLQGAVQFEAGQSGPGFQKFVALTKGPFKYVPSVTLADGTVVSATWAATGPSGGGEGIVK